MVDTDQIWEELRTSLHRYVGAKVKAEVAEDLVHDILLRVLQNEQKFLAADNPIAWVYTIARNRIADYYRSTSKLKSTDVNVDEISADTEEQLDNEFAKCLRPLVERLDEKYKQALLLTDFAERKQADAAENIGISVSGMKSRVQRARSKLKNELLECCAIEVDRFGNVVEYQQKSNCKQTDCC